MFVCHGNICRSPMAEFIFKKIITESRVGREYLVKSSATSTEEIWGNVGNPVYPPAREELARHGLSCEGKRAVQVTKADYSAYDLLICMDGNNVRNLLRITGGDPDGKVRKLMDYTARGGDVADPWYCGHFDVTYRDICEGCEALLNDLLENQS